MYKTAFRTMGAALALAVAATSAHGQDQDASKDAIITALTKDLADYQAKEEANKRNLDEFDVLDFEVYSNKQWDRFTETHADNIVVHYPDGHTTTDLEAHLGELKWFVSWMPDSRVKEHPIRFGDGEYTGVIGVLEGTFTEPMILPDGTRIEPTGKAVKMQMTTIGHWTDAGQMDEEWLFWDNQEFSKQAGIGQ